MKSNEIKRIFLAALDLSDPQQRNELLDVECGADSELRRRVEMLLRAHDDPASVVDHPIGGSLTKANPVNDSLSQIGQVLAGKYKLLEPIGEGGMGSVWVAEQFAPVKRKVAIKLVKPGMDSRQVLARFEAERQALALMDHPNIAKIFDGGLTDQGRPFFVMELVKGLPVTEYCDQVRLSLTERLKLFELICQAVQHAHQKGIIHRDLKPSNVLVGMYDGKPVPKVIDFGLAKALHHSLTDQTLHTGLGIMIGTPLYMSPEQAEHNNLDVDTRTDIYSLGVLLYELLTGSTPLERAQMKDAAYNEVLRLIKEVDPPRPSTRLSGSASLPSVAAQRNIEPALLSKSLSGDLDWIVMKALEKERGRRYETANGLARDIDRFLADEPVEACPPTNRYKIRKYVRRNQGKVIAGALILGALLLGMTGTTWGFFRARQQATIANREAEQKELARQSEAERAEGERVAKQQAVLQRVRAEKHESQAIDAVKRFRDAVADEKELRNNPALRELRNRLLKEPLAFFRSLRDRLQADRDTQKDSLIRLAEACFDLGVVSREVGDRQDALAAFSEAMEVYEQLVASNPELPGLQSTLAQICLQRSNCQRDTGKPEEALASCERALQISQKLAAATPDNPDFEVQTANALSNMAYLLGSISRTGESLSAYQASLAIRRRLAQRFPDEASYRPQLAEDQIGYGILLSHIGKPVDAIKSCESAAEILSQLVDDFPSETNYQSKLAQCYNSIGVLFMESDETLKAIAPLELGLSIQQKLAIAFPASTDIQDSLATNFNNLAALQGANKDFEASRRNNDAALAIRESLAKSHPLSVYFQTRLAETHTNRGNIFNFQGNPDGARLAYEESAAVLGKLAREHPGLPEVEFALGLSRHNSALIDLKANRFEVAIERLNEAITWQKKALAANPASPRGRQALMAELNNLIAAYQGLGNTAGIAAAERELQELASSDPEMRELDRKLAVVSDGLEKPQDNRERLVLAMHAYSTRRYAAARQLWRDAMVTAPSISDDRAAQHRYNAACSAALAAAGLSEGEPRPDDTTIIQWRSEALVWLEAELVAWTELSKSASSEQLAFIIETLQHWKKDTDLASIRDSVSLKSLPEIEQESWKSLWAKVDQLLESLD